MAVLVNSCGSYTLLGTLPPSVGSDRYSSPDYSRRKLERGSHVLDRGSHVFLRGEVGQVSTDLTYPKSRG
jgi:hypothetical protein